MKIQENYCLLLFFFNYCFLVIYMIKMQEQRNVVMKKFRQNKVLSFLDLWLHFHSRWFTLNFYKLPGIKIIYASIRSSTVKLVNQRLYIYIQLFPNKKAASVAGMTQEKQ